MTGGNGVATTPGTLRWLAASQTFYRSAGRWRAAQLLFVVVVPTTVAVYGAFQAHQDSWIPFVGFVAAIADATLFNWGISGSRYSAAQLASLYDASLVGKGPLSPRTAGMPSVERIRDAEHRYMRGPGARADAERWHYHRIQEVKPPIAELLYIRSDLGQDEQLREHYVLILGTVAAFGIVGLLAAGVATGWDMGRLFANVLFPLVPAAAWLGRELVDQQNALSRKRCLRVLHDERLFSEQVHPRPEDPLLFEREAMHGMQFLFRSTQPSVAWWLNLARRRRLRETMEAVLDRFVEDAINSGQGIASPPPGAYTQR